MGKRLPALAGNGMPMEKAQQRKAYEEMIRLDPTSVYARCEVAAARIEDGSTLQRRRGSDQRVVRA